VAVEVCDERDNDCNGLVDDQAVDRSTWYLDVDGDGYGSVHLSTEACLAPPGYVANGLDCNDTDISVYPGAAEVCDEIDNDCNAEVDEGPAAPSTWYADSDGDGYGNAAMPVSACTAPPGYVADSSDCNDLDPASSPVAVEVCDEIDNNCDGQVDEGGAAPSTWYADYDGDTFGNTALSATTCVAPLGFVATGGDCDDLDATSYPGSLELCDGVDNNCEGTVDEGVTGTYYIDSDNDGYGDPGTPLQACFLPAGASANDLDCDDGAANAHPGGVEVCDGIDNDCTGAVDDNALDALTWYLDGDNDGSGAPGTGVSSCSAIAGTVSNDSDCDDSDADNFPGNLESCDGQDEDCDGSADDGFDSDGDGATSCGPDGIPGNSDDDCDDNDPGNAPGNAEACDGDDNDCDGVVDNGLDGDGDGVTSCGPDGIPGNSDDDCDDSDPGNAPGNTETCDGVDNDCDSLIDEGAVGVGSACPAASCAAVLQGDPNAPDGVYWLDPDGSGGVAAYQIYCLQSIEGGGWSVQAYLRQEPHWDIGIFSDSGSVGDTASGFASGATLSTANSSYNEKIVVYLRLIENGNDLGQQWMADTRTAGAVSYNGIDSSSGWSYRDSFGTSFSNAGNVCSHGCSNYRGFGMFTDYSNGHGYHGTQTGNYGCADGNNICWMSRGLGLSCNVGSSRCSLLSGPGEGVIYAVR